MTCLDHFIDPTAPACIRQFIPAGALLAVGPSFDPSLPSLLGLLYGEVDAGRPAVYVDCGVYGLTDRTARARKLIGGPLFRALLDRDEFVVVPSVDPASGKLQADCPHDNSFPSGAVFRRYRRSPDKSSSTKNGSDQRW
jgi:hypothetical protein